MGCPWTEQTFYYRFFFRLLPSTRFDRGLDFISHLFSIFKFSWLFLFIIMWMCYFFFSIFIRLCLLACCKLWRHTDCSSQNPIQAYDVILTSHRSSYCISDRRSFMSSLFFLPIYFKRTYLAWWSNIWHYSHHIVNRTRYHVACIISYCWFCSREEAAWPCVATISPSPPRCTSPRAGASAAVYGSRWGVCQGIGARWMCFAPWRSATGR